MACFLGNQSQRELSSESIQFYTSVNVTTITFLSRASQLATDMSSSLQVHCYFLILILIQNVAISEIVNVQCWSSRDNSKQCEACANIAMLQQCVMFETWFLFPFAALYRFRAFSRALMWFVLACLTLLYFCLFSHALIRVLRNTYSLKEVLFLLLPVIKLLVRDLRLLK